MIIKYYKIFEKQFRKLSTINRGKILKIIDIFVKNPHNRQLKNHSLRGNLLGKKSISAGSDLGIIFEEFDNYTLVIFLDLGKHNRVYK